MIHGGAIAFNLVEDTTPHRHKAIITIGKEHIDALYNEALSSQKMQTHTYGFSRGNTPEYYIEQNYRSNIVEHIKELLFTHCVVQVLYASLSDNKIVIAGDPDLLDIQLRPDEDAQFVFSITDISLDNDERWKRLSLKAPERKNYLDLDRQVESALKEETELRAQYKDNGIQLGDWVNFDISLINKNNQCLLHNYKSNLWLRLSGDESDLALQDIFLGKRVGESVLTQSAYFQEYISFNTDMHYTFKIDITDYIPTAFFNFDLLNHHFSLKNEKETHQKLIEVFSTRNDISQRRETVEAALKLLGKQYYFMLPHELLERQRLAVLAAVQQSHDYHVYKAQHDFKERIKQLAEKQLKEMIIIDTIAYQEGITVSKEDIEAYLNFTNRARMKEFLYFMLPAPKMLGQDIPLSGELVSRYARREKTLNYVINHLIKKTKT